MIYIEIKNMEHQCTKAQYTNMEGKIKKTIFFNLLKSLLIIDIKLSCFLLATILIFYCVSLSGNEDFSLEEEVSSPSDVLENLEELKENPVDINSATYEDMLQIPYITPLIALRIIDYRTKGNVFSDTLELSKIAGISEPLLHKILPYVVFKKKLITPKKIIWKSIVSKQYPLEDKYNGSPFKYSNKLEIANGNITLGGTAYKNAYEKNYLDFYTLYGYVKRKNYGIILGDYAINAGEKLILGYPGFIFKSSGMIKGKQSFIKPYTSGFEDYSLRGAALKKNWKMLDVGLFASYKKLDATVENDTVRKVLYANSYHRTETEIAKKDRIKERLLGGILSIGNKRFNISSTSLIANYDKTVKPDPANYYRFSGKQYGLTGIHSFFVKEYISIWSDFAYSFYTGGSGFIIGTSMRPNKATISLLYRDYSEKFYSPRAFSFCENQVRNERGLYLYIATKLPYSIHFSGFTDIFTRPNPTYFNLFSTNGYEVFLSVEKKLMHTNLYMRYKNKEKNSYQWQGQTLTYQRQNLRLSFKTKINKNVYFKVIWEGERFYLPDIDLSEFGNLLSLYFNAKPFSNTTLQFGIAFYETDSYNSRIYLFLNDIPGSMYTKAFYGSGKDFYLLLKNRIFNNLSVYARFELNSKEEENTKFIKFGMQWR